MTFIPIDSNNKSGFQLAVRSVAMQDVLTSSFLLTPGQGHADVMRLPISCKNRNPALSQENLLKKAPGRADWGASSLPLLQ